MAGRFISKELFRKKAEERRDSEKLTDWVDLSQEIIYKIISLEQRESKDYGVCFIANLVDSAGRKERVWAPRKLVADLRDKRKPNEIPYILSLGQVKYDKTKKENKFDLSFQEDEGRIYIYEDEEISDAN